jgi:drug/metabolite transporter (DMT)-like permease
MVFGVLMALAAGATFAVAAVLQQRAAARRPGEESLSFRLIVQLARQRVWQAGLAVAVLAYAFQAVALFAAPLSVVQPLLVSDVVFAIPVSVWLHRMRLHLRDWAGVLAVAGGLSLAIAAADPRPGNPLVPVTAWIPLVAVILGVSAAAIAVGRLLLGPGRAALYALAASLILGLEAALMSATTHRFELGAVAGFTAWEAYAMAVCSIAGMLLIQSAYQAGPLAVSMPVLDAVQPLVAIGVGLLLFGESVASSTGRLAAAAVGLVVLLAGIVALDTSPVVHRLHQRQRADAAQDAARRRHHRPPVSAIVTRRGP